MENSENFKFLFLFIGGLSIILELLFDFTRLIEIPLKVAIREREIRGNLKRALHLSQKIRTENSGISFTKRDGELCIFSEHLNVANENAMWRDAHNERVGNAAAFSSHKKASARSVAVLLPVLASEWRPF